MMEGTSWVELFKKWNTRKSIEVIVEEIELERDIWEETYNSSKQKGEINDYADGRSDGLSEAIGIARKKVCDE